MTDNISEQTLKAMLSIVLEKKGYFTKSKEESEENTPKSSKNSTSCGRKSRRPTREPRAEYGHGSESIITKRIRSLEDPTVTIHVGKFAFRANMEVLEMYSEFFKRYHELKEIVLPEAEVSPIAFVAIYEWILADDPRLPRKGLIELYKAATFLEVPVMLAQFWECMSSPLNYEDRAFLLYLEGLAIDAPQVRKTMLQRISRFFLPIVACEEFLHLPIEDLSILLKSNLIGVNSEIEVYYACVRYFNFDWDKRKARLLSIMSLIRFDFIPINFLLVLLNGGSEDISKVVTRMVEHPALQETLRDLVQFNCMKAFPGPKSVSLPKSMHRNWIYDPQCDYHKHQCPPTIDSDFLGYLEFVAYLRFLVAKGPYHWKSFNRIHIEAESGEENEENWNILT